MTEGSATVEARERVLAGTFECIARVGIGKTTVEDAARASGVSRATVYRLFPGGRDELLRDTVAWEMARFFAHLGTELGPMPDFETFLEHALPLAREQVLATRGAPEGARDRARPAHAAHHRRAAPRDLLHRGVLPAARSSVTGTQASFVDGVDLPTLRGVRRPDGAVAHRLARPPRPRGPRRGAAASSAGSSSEASWPGRRWTHPLNNETGSGVLSQRDDRRRGLDIRREIRCRAARDRRRSSSASPASACRRPPSTTSPAKRDARGPRSTATSTARARSCGAPSTSSSSASPRRRSRRRRASRRSPTRSSRSSPPPRASLVDHRALQFLLAHEPESDPRPARVRSRRPRPRPRRRRVRAGVRAVAVGRRRAARRRLARTHPPFLRAHARNRRSISPTPSRPAASSWSS